MLLGSKNWETGEHTRLPQVPKTGSRSADPIQNQAKFHNIWELRLQMPKIRPPAIQVFKEFDHE
jgi:hypothetical protein